MRIRDVYPGSEFFTPRILDPGYEFSPFRIRIKEFKYGILIQKIVFKLSEIGSQVVHPGSGSWFFTHSPDPGDQKDNRIPDLQHTA